MKFQEITSIKDLRNDDLPMVVVDRLDDTFVDKFGRTHPVGAHVVGDKSVHVIPVSRLKQDFLIAHETFHQFDLEDEENDDTKGNLMYHLSDAGENGVNKLTNTQLTDAVLYLTGYPAFTDFGVKSQYVNQSKRSKIFIEEKDNIIENKIYKINPQKATKAGLNPF